MKSWLIGILLITLLTDPLKISEINKAKREAREAFNKGDFKTAITKYKYLSDTLEVREDELNLNLAHAYFQTKDTANAYSIYQQLASSTQNTIRSKAQLQLGIMHHQQNKLEEALHNFKQAIKADPNNRDARYNYEILKKKLDEKKKQQEQQKQDKDQQKQDPQNKDQQKQDQQKQDQQKQDQQKQDQQKQDHQKQDQQKQDQQKQEQQQNEQQSKEQQKKEEEEKKKQESQQQKEQQQKDQKKEMPKEVADKLEQMKIDPDKARMILEAMKNQEVQYLQQNKRKATKSKDKSKPDW